LQNSITSGGGKALVLRIGILIVATISPQFLTAREFDNPYFRFLPPVLYFYGEAGILWWGYTATLAHLRETRERIRFQRWSYQILEEMYVLDFPESDLIRVRNMLVDAPDAAGGFRFAIEFAKKLLPPGLRDDKPILSSWTTWKEGGPNAA
jgi:hypothetical protein